MMPPITIFLWGIVTGAIVTLALMVFYRHIRAWWIR